MKFPTILSQSRDGDALQFELEISEDLSWFTGHFPGLPVLPGVVQLRWAVELAQQHFGIETGPQEVLRLKFKSVVVPPRNIVLTLSRSGDAEAAFEYTGPGEVYSKGKLKFSETTQ